MKLCYCKTSIFNIYQSWARNNSVATMWPWFQGTKLFVVAILLYLLWLPYLDTVAYNYFSNFFWSLTGPWGSVTLSRCCCREAKKLSRAQLWLVVLEILECLAILNLITDDSRKLFCIWFGWESALFSDSFRPSRELISWLGGAIWNWFMRNKQTENLVTQNYYKKVRPRNSSYVNIVPGCVPLSAPSIPSSWRKNQDSQR